MDATSRHIGVRVTWIPRGIGLLALLWVLLSGSAHAEIQGLWFRHQPPPVVRDATMALTVEARSSAGVSGIAAELGASVFPLSLSYFDEISGSTFWTAVIPLGEPGEKRMVVTAWDATGASMTMTAQFVYDPWPTLTITSPTARDVATPVIDVDAVCVDSGSAAGCTELTVSYRPLQNGAALGPTSGVLASGTNTLRASLDFSQWDPSSGDLVFAFADSGGARVEMTLPIEVASSPSFEEAERVEGTIVAADCARLLVVAPDRSSIAIHDRTTGEASLLTGHSLSNLGTDSWVYALHPHGALYGGSDLLEWHDGELTLVARGPVMSLRVAGRYVIWNEGTRLTRRDLVTRTNVLVSDAATTWGNGLAANGDVVFGTTGEQIARWEDGALEQLTHDPPGVTHRAPAADETNTVYTRVSTETIDAITSTRAAIVLANADGETILDPGVAYTSYPRYPRDDASPRQYRVANGRVAFDALRDGVRQVFIREMSGQVRQITAFEAVHSTLEALDDAGTVMFRNGLQRYIARPGSAPEAVAGIGGVAMRIDDGWYMANGGSLYALAGGATCSNQVPEDGGVDGGVADAGVPADAGNGDAGVPGDGGGGNGGGHGHDWHRTLFDHLRNCSVSPAAIADRQGSTRALGLAALLASFAGWRRVRRTQRSRRDALSVTRG